MSETELRIVRFFCGQRLYRDETELRESPGDLPVCEACARNYEARTREKPKPPEIGVYHAVVGTGFVGTVVRRGDEYLLVCGTTINGLIPWKPSKYELLFPVAI